MRVGGRGEIGQRERESVDTGVQIQPSSNAYQFDECREYVGETRRKEGTPCVCVYSAGEQADEQR